MMCPACDKKKIATDQIVCLRCALDARELARLDKTPSFPPSDWEIETAFVTWAKQVRAEGGSLSLAMMAETGHVPHGCTDTTFMGGYTDVSGAQFDGKHPVVQREYTQPAKDAGVSITGKRYFSELARFPGDPEAWVGSKAEAAAVVASRPGWASDDLGVKAADGPAKKAPKMRSYKSVLAEAMGK